MPVEEHLGQHVRAGEGELEPAAGQLPGAAVIARQVQEPLAQLALHHPGRLRPVAHPRLLSEPAQLLAGDGSAHAGHRPDEVVDHPVRFRVVHVEPIQLPIRHQVDPRQLLGVKHDRGRVSQRLLAGKRREPVRNRVAADNSGLDLRHGLASVGGFPLGGRFSCVGRTSTSTSTSTST